MFIQARNTSEESTGELVNLNIANIISFRETSTPGYIAPVTEFIMTNGDRYKLAIHAASVEAIFRDNNLMVV